MPGTEIRQEAKKLVESLPADATWEELAYEIYVREAIEGGIADSDAGRTAHAGDVRVRYGLRPIGPRRLRS